MKQPDTPDNEQSRLKALESYDILDSLSESEYDDIVAVAHEICQTKIAVISFVDEKRQWFKSTIGLNIKETSRDISFCGHTINQPNDIFVVADARLDERFSDNPLVTGDPNIVFYAGVPLIDENSFALGTLCVIDSSPKTLTENQKKALQLLARNVVSLLRSKKKSLELSNEKTFLLEAINYSSPFFLMIDFNSTIIEFGHNYSISITEIRKGKLLSDYFIWESEFNTEKLLASNFYENKLLFYKTIDGRQRYKCSIKKYYEDKIILFSTPVINSLQPIANYNLNINSFPKQDYIAEYLFLQQAATKGLEDARQLADNLKGKNKLLEFSKSSLIKVNSTLEEKVNERTKLLLASQRELEESNTELEAQTQKLQASDEELRGQQEELLQSNKELEEKTKLVEEKNHAFNEKNNLLVAATTDLKRKADQLTLSSKYKSEFLANMSHELRTPLNSILLLSKLLRDNLEDNLSEDQIEYSAVINKAGNSLLELINDILDLSKIESGKMDVNAETLNVNIFAGDIQSLFNPIAKDKEIEFKVLVNSDCPESMYTDKMRLDQVVKNLLSNAFKFSAKGKVDLTISYNLQQDMISFSVVDTGIGIAKDKQALVFEAFQQADGSTKRKYGGTGLGLSISREIAHLLGGEITLESEVGVGSNFTITIPANYSLENLKKQTKKSSSTLNLTLAPDLTPDKETDLAILVDDDRNVIEKKDKTILIVEDDIYFVKILQNSAKSRGYKVLVAVNGMEAVELAKKYIPTGIILDLHLPKKSGWKVLKELKDFAETKHIPVHIVSSQDLDSKTIRESGAIDFTNKPISDDSMQNVFRSLEEIASKETGKIALFSDKKEHALAMTEFLKERHIEISTFNPDVEIDDSIVKGGFDAILIDIDTRKSKIPNLLEKLTKVLPNKLMPVIVLSNTYLSSLDVKRINHYNEAFILKIVKSYSSIIDEMSFFLHYITKKGEAIKMRPAIISAKTLENKKILLVDDDAENRFSISKILEAQKAEVIQATNGKEAIDVWKNNHDISLILMDVMMPEMDGYEAIKQIRKLDNGKNIPIISLTAKTQADEREKCINSGASDYASKPIDADLLISLTKIWILNSDKK